MSIGLPKGLVKVGVFVAFEVELTVNLSMRVTLFIIYNFVKDIE